MDRVSTSGNYALVLANLMAAQQRQLEAGQQVSSEKKADDLKGYARNAETLTAMRALQAKVDGFLDQTDLLSSKLSMQDTALNQVADAAQSARDAIANALATGRADTLMQELQNAFSNTIQGLNTKFQGEYLFAGGQVNTKPTTAVTLSDLTAAPSIAGLFQNDQFKVSNRLDESTTIQTGFLADQIGTPLFTAFQGVEAFEQGASGPFNGTLTTAQRTYLQSVLATFDTVHDNLIKVAGQNGLYQKEAESAQKDLTGRQTTLANMVGGITDVNMAEAVSRLQQAQISVQGAAQVFASLKGSSLLEILTP
jgi:flagellar hook-associated protein 3 FlgL